MLFCRLRPCNSSTERVQVLRRHRERAGEPAPSGGSVEVSGAAAAACVGRPHSDLRCIAAYPATLSQARQARKERIGDMVSHWRDGGSPQLKRHGQRADQTPPLPLPRRRPSGARATPGGQRRRQAAAAVAAWSVRSRISCFPSSRRCCLSSIMQVAGGGHGGGRPQRQQLALDGDGCAAMGQGAAGRYVGHAGQGTHACTPVLPHALRCAWPGRCMHARCGR